MNLPIMEVARMAFMGYNSWVGAYPTKTKTQKDGYFLSTIKILWGEEAE